MLRSRCLLRAPSRHNPTVRPHSRRQATRLHPTLPVHSSLAGPQARLGRLKRLVHTLSSCRWLHSSRTMGPGEAEPSEWPKDAGEYQRRLNLGQVCLTRRGRWRRGRRGRSRSESECARAGLAGSSCQRRCGGCTRQAGLIRVIEEHVLCSQSVGAKEDASLHFGSEAGCPTVRIDMRCFSVICAQRRVYPQSCHGDQTIEPRSRPTFIPYSIPSYRARLLLASAVAIT